MSTHMNVYLVCDANDTSVMDSILDSLRAHNLKWYFADKWWHCMDDQMWMLGNRCELGEYCKLGEHIDVRATFEDGRVQDGLYVQIGNIGSEYRTAYFYIDKDGAMFVRAGCWFSGIKYFKVRVKDVHGGTIYEAQYMAACAYAEAVLPQMLKKSDAERKDHHEN